MFTLENLKVVCTYCGKEMKRTLYDEEGIIKAQFSCKSDPSCELSQVEITMEGN